MGLLAGKKALIVGLASKHSIAYGIAQAMHQQGAELAFTYQGERFADRVTKMAQSFGSELAFSCDVSSDSEILAVFKSLSSYWESFDILVHSVAYAPSDQLSGKYAEVVNREGFRIAHDISSYSLAALCQAAMPYLSNSASVMALTYLGALRAVPGYNVMGVAKASLEANIRYLAHSLGPKGIRVNGISAGPIRTLAASGIDRFREMLSYNEKTAPLRANVTIEQVGNVASFLGSDLSQGITGDILYVDGGFHITAMPDL